MRLTILAATAVALSSASALAQSVEMGSVPPTIIAVAKQAAPGVEFSKAGVDVDADTLMPVYEITGKGKNGMQVEIDILPTGEVDEIEHQIELTAVPEAVQRTLKEYLPQFQASMVEHSVRQHGLVFFEFAGQHDGREIDVEVNEAGNIIMINDDAAA